MEAFMARLTTLVECNCQERIDADHAVTVECIGGAENLLFEISCKPGDVGLIIGNEGRNIVAIRTLVKSACRGANVRAAVEVTKSRR
jgi:predicted RNA-binding protein YlqC (UPF0109 family)